MIVFFSVSCVSFIFLFVTVVHVCQESIMSLLNFPPEVALQFIKKMKLIDRINLSMAHTSLLPLCFDKLFPISLNELRQLYEQSRTEKERDLCFKSNVLDKVLIKNFNEVVHMHMDPKNKEFLKNGKIFDSLEGKFVLEGEKEKFSTKFLHKFLCLLDRAKGTILLAFIDVELFGMKYAEYCSRIIMRKLESQKVYCIEFCKTDQSDYSCTQQIRDFMLNGFTILYTSYQLTDTSRIHYTTPRKRNSVANTKEVIAMINEDSLIKVKQHLGTVLALLEAAELPGYGRIITCGNCSAGEDSTGELMMSLWMSEPDWSNCAGCLLK